MKRIYSMICVGIVTVAFASTSTPALHAENAHAPAASVVAPAPAAVPQLTNTQKIALQKIVSDFRSVQDAQKQIQQAQREAAGELQAFEADFAKDHPGWHFDAATGQVTKDAPEPPSSKKR
ncbi:MAG: hypothetical protein ACLGPM_07775 [Acidobacteriota bacterium]